MCSIMRAASILLASSDRGRSILSQAELEKLLKQMSVLDYTYLNLL